MKDFKISLQKSLLDIDEKTIDEIKDSNSIITMRFSAKNTLLNLAISELLSLKE